MEMILPPGGVWLHLICNSLDDMSNAPLRFTCWTLCHRLCGIERNAWNGQIPALETRTSILSNLASAAATMTVAVAKAPMSLLTISADRRTILFRFEGLLHL